MLRAYAASMALMVAALVSFLPATALSKEVGVLQALDKLEFPFTPNRAVTPGSRCTPSDPDFERYRYEEEIAYCARSVDSSLKRAIYADYGISRECQKQYTIDHLIPLSLGGTNHRDNLWPEAKVIKSLRQNLEYQLFRQLEDGEITQEQAIRTILNAKLHPPVRDPDDFEFCF